MSNIDKHALREAAEKAGSDEWFAFIDTKSKTYSVHTPGDNRCGDVVKWAGFDGQKRAADKARFIAAANPATVLALLDELEVVNELFLRAKALMYQSGGTPIENSLNPIDAWLYDAERAAAAGKGEAS
ncbi:ead/Ea22-like family protein [Enterobacter sichuanensis]|uniref:ead/Ea22-like family protein n=1 Tax=Enterobacter sichuanensis TaxID=2071710 RepID=UPI001747BF84